MMTLFDAPDRESSCVRRSRTNTSLQSLGLLNETQRIEMACVLSERLLQAADNDDSRLDELFSLIACRPPTTAERDACHGLLRTTRQRFAAERGDAMAFLAAGAAARHFELDPIEQASWAQVAVTVLASDAAIMLY